MAADRTGAEQKSLGAHKNYYIKAFVAKLRQSSVTPHIAEYTTRHSGPPMDGRTTCNEGCAKSINARPGMEKVLGWWIKQWGGLRRFKVCGTDKASALFGLHMIDISLIRLGNVLNPAMETASTEGCPEL